MDAKELNSEHPCFCTEDEICLPCHRRELAELLSRPDVRKALGRD